MQIEMFGNTCKLCASHFHYKMKMSKIRTVKNYGNLNLIFFTMDYISIIEQSYSIFVGKDKTKSGYLKIFKSQYLVEFINLLLCTFL